MDDSRKFLTLSMVKVSQEVGGCEYCEVVLLQTVRATLKAEVAEQAECKFYIVHTLCSLWSDCVHVLLSGGLYWF